jgi:hypothetical protein
MEDIMKASTLGQCETHHDIVNEFDHLIGPVEPRLELPGGLQRQGRWSAMPKAEERPVPDLIHHRPVVGVVVLLVDCLRLFQPVPDIVEELRSFLHAAGDRRNPGLTRLIRPYGRRIPAVDDAERRVVQGRLERGVEDELGPRQPAQPLLGAISSKTTEIHDDDPVGRFGLAIRLG